MDIMGKKLHCGDKLEHIFKAARDFDKVDLTETQRNELWEILNRDLEEYLPLLLHIAEYAIVLSDTPINNDCFANEIIMVAKQVEALRIWSNN